MESGWTEHAICAVRADGEKPSWTAKLLRDPQLLCRKVREEAGELCQTLEENEGPQRAASEAADLLYHSLVLLNLQVGRLWMPAMRPIAAMGPAPGSTLPASVPC